VEVTSQPVVLGGGEWRLSRVGTAGVEVVARRRRQRWRVEGEAGPGGGDRRTGLVEAELRATRSLHR
jgi:hypothetical protein